MFGKLFKKGKKKDVEKMLSEKIDSIERHPVARSADHRLFLSCYELGGYYYLHFDLVGTTKVRTTSGGRVTFIAQDSQIDVPTDSEEIETDFNRDLGIGATGFDVDKEVEVTRFLTENELTGIELRIQSKNVFFDEIDSEALKAGLIPPVIPDEEE